jgi:hypothetical protein
MPFKKGEPNPSAFKKGQSGNPGGRSAFAEEIKELAQQHCPEAIERLVYIMKHGEPHSAQVMAADKILDRGCGRAPQAVVGADGEGPITVEIVYRPREGSDERE